MTEVEIRFIFANNDGINVNIKTDTSILTKDIKLLLLEKWPQGILPCDDYTRIRLFCMGAILDDLKPLGPKFPISSHPTPVNVSVRPAGTVASTPVPKPTVVVPSSRNNALPSSATVPIVANERCCCQIS